MNRGDGSRERKGLLTLTCRVALLGLVLLMGCHLTPHVCDRTSVSAKVADRTGYPFNGSPPCDGRVVMPNGASLADGLTEDEAVMIALWNNALFNELLTDLGVARGD